MKKKIILAIFALSVLQYSNMALGEETLTKKVPLENVQVLDSENYSIKEEAIFDLQGNICDSNNICFDESKNAYVVYRLNGEYETISGEIAVPDDMDDAVNMNLAIFADGILIYSKSDITKQFSGENFTIDVSGIAELEMRTSNNDEYDRGCLYILNGSASISDDICQAVRVARLKDNVLIDSQHFEFKEGLMRDSYGNLHNGCYEFETPSESEALFNLSKQYVSLSGVLDANVYANDAKVTVSIYLDDQLAFYQDGITTKTAPIPFELDVSDVDVVRFVTSKQTGEGWWKMIIVDDILKPHEHTPGEWQIDEEPTCTNEGKKVRMCTKCGVECEEELLEALGHQPDGKYVTAKEATCWEEGIDVQHCKVCGEECEEKKVSKLEHIPEEEWVIQKEATCQYEGEKTRICSLCGTILENEAIPKLDHKAGDWTEEQSATCEEAGISARYCEICGEIMETKAIPLKEHQYSSWCVVSGSIWNAPIIKQRICSVCMNCETKKNYLFIWVKPLVILIAVVVFIVVLRSAFSKYKRL